MANHRGGAGNFAEDRERASEAGRKGGQMSGGNLKTIRSGPLRRGRKAEKTATAAAAVNRTLPIPGRRISGGLRLRLSAPRRACTLLGLFILAALCLYFHVTLSPLSLRKLC